jgi:sugar phosphate isomerase/epimerase
MHAAAKEHAGQGATRLGRTPMLIGARQDCVAGNGDLHEKLSVLKNLGYDFLELPLTRDQIAHLEPGSASEYVQLIERAGLPILSTSMGHFGGFAAASPAERAGIIDHIRATIALTKAIGADTILLATTENDDHVERYAGIYRQELLPVAEEAAMAGVTLALEHVGWYKPHHLARLVRAIDHPAVGIYFDMGNCLYVGENPLEQARICGPLTVQLHVKGGPVLPLGAMPLVAVRDILETAGFQGRACLEIASGEGNRPLAEARGLLKMAGYC